MAAPYSVSTAVANKLPVKIIIPKNNSLAEVKFEQKEMGNPEYGCTLSPIDFLAFAKACGADGFRCERPEEVRSAIQAALNSPGPAIVEAIVDAEEKPEKPNRQKALLMRQYWASNGGRTRPECRHAARPKKPTLNNARAAQNQLPPHRLRRRLKPRLQRPGRQPPPVTRPQKTVLPSGGRQGRDAGSRHHTKGIRRTVQGWFGTGRFCASGATADRRGAGSPSGTGPNWRRILAKNSQGMRGRMVGRQGGNAGAWHYAKGLC
jgi:Thiamine pyrophosphate enzyme, C-terminal TPP binding domain